MPYSNAQLSAYYQSLTGTAPTGADAVLINAYATQSQNGTLSDTNTLLGVFNSAGVQGTFEVIESTYQFFTGTGVNAGGLAMLESATSSGNSSGLNSSYYTGFNTENRYYNFAINLASAGGAGNAAFVSSYGNLTFAQTVAGAYEQIVGSSNVGSANANAAIADISARQSFFVNVANQRAGGVDAGGAAGQMIALKAIVIGYILEEANKADVGTYAKAIDQLEAAVAAVGSGAAINSPFGSNIITTFGSNGSGFNSGFNALGANNNNQINFSLTTSIDTFQPTTGGIQFVGVVNQNGNTGQFNPSTLQAGDQIRGTGANNTLTVDTVGIVGDATGGAFITGIQTINVRSVADPQAGAGGAAAGQGATLNANLVTGATMINEYLGTGGLTINNLGTSVGVGIVGSGGQSGGLLTANYVTGGTAVVNLAGGTTATAAGAGSSLLLANTGSAANTLSTVQVNSNGGLNNLANLTIPASVSELDLSSTSPLNVLGATTTGGAASNLKILRATGGGGAINLGATDIGGGAANTGSITTVDTTGLTSTGGLTARFFTTSGTTPAAYSLGAGADRLTLDGDINGITSVNLGEGSNRLTLNGSLIGTNNNNNNVNSGGATNASITSGSSADIITISTQANNSGGNGLGNVGAGTSIITGGGGDTVNVQGTVTAAAASSTTQTTINGGGSGFFVTNAADFRNISAFNATARAAITGFQTDGVYDPLTNVAAAGAANTTYDVTRVGGALNFATVGVAAGQTVTVNTATGALISFQGNLGNGTAFTAAGGTNPAGGTLATNTGVLNVTETAVAAGNSISFGYQNQTTTDANGNPTAATLQSNIVTTSAITALTFIGTESVRGGIASAANNNVATGATINLNLTDTSATSITFAGNDAFVFLPTFTAGVGNNASTGFGGLRTIDGSASTGDLFINVAAIPSSLNLPVTVTTGGGNDLITVRDFDRVTTGAATVATGQTTLGFNTINVGVTTTGQTYSTVLDAKVNDHFNFGTTAANTGTFTATSTSVNTNKIVLQSTAGFQDYLDAATAQGVGIGTVSAFDFGGNTYLVENNNGNGGNNTFENGFDSVIQLVGIHTLTTSAAGSPGVAILGS